MTARCLACGSTGGLVYGLTIGGVQRRVCFWCWTAPRRKPIGGSQPLQPQEAR